MSIEMQATTCQHAPHVGTLVELWAAVYFPLIGLVYFIYNFDVGKTCSLPPSRHSGAACVARCLRGLCLAASQQNSACALRLAPRILASASHKQNIGNNYFIL